MTALPHHAPAPALDALCRGGPPPRPLGQPLPTPRAIGLAIAVVEAMVGRRALHQVRPHMGPQAFANLVRYSDSRRLAAAPIGRIRAQAPDPGRVEVTGTLQVAHRWLACAVQVVQDDGWRCTELHVVGLTGGRLPT